MNFGEMIQQSRFLVGDTGANTYFDDEDVKLAINNGSVEVARATLGLMTYQDFDTISGDDVTLPADDPRREGRYPFPHDLLSLKDVQIIDGTNRYQLKNETYDNFETLALARVLGRPERYRAEFGSTSISGIEPGDIWFYPIPDKLYTGRIVYYQQPTKMVLDEDTCELPASMHLTVVYYACMLLCMRDDDDRRMGKFAGLYREALENDKMLVSKLNRTGPQGIVAVYGDTTRRRGRGFFRDR